MPDAIDERKPITFELNNVITRETPESVEVPAFMHRDGRWAEFFTVLEAERHGQRAAAVRRLVTAVTAIREEALEQGRRIGQSEIRDALKKNKNAANPAA